MGLGDFLKDAGETVAGGIHTVAKGANVVDRYINPFHVERGGESGTFHGLELGQKTLDALAVPGRPLRHSLESAMEGIRWTYDNGISQPLSTSFLVLGQTDWNGRGLSKTFSGSEWSRAWRTANHVSPGQALFTSPEEARRVLDSEPLYATPPASYLPPGWDDMSEDEQQEMLKKAGMPIIGNREIERMRRDSTFFKYASGTADFAARWWLDPVVLGLKGAGLARDARVTKRRPAEGWDAQDIDRLINGSNMAKARTWLWNNRENPQLINNLDMARKSALGPRMGNIVSTLKSEDEVTDFLRVTMGDVEARARLEAENLTAANRIQKDTARLPELGLSLSHAEPGSAAAKMIERRMAEVQRQINADTDLVSRYEGMLNHYGELDAINLTRASFARAARRTDAQNAYRTRSAMGGRTPKVRPGLPPVARAGATPREEITAGTAIGKSRIYDSFFGTPLTLVRSFKEAHPNGYISIRDLDRDSVAELRGHIARIPGIGPDIRADLLNRYLKTTTEGQRLDLLDEVGSLGVKKVAERHGFTEDEGLALYSEYRKRMGIETENLRRYSAATMEQGGTRIHVDEFMDAGGKLVLHPNLVTRLVNDHVMIDLQALDKTLARHGSALKALRVPGGKASDLLKDGADWFSSVWKFGTLFRLGYIPRVLGDDLAGQVARLGAATMALRAGYGIKNGATNLASWRPSSFYEAREAAARQGVRYADEELALVTPQADRLRQSIQARQAVAQADIARAQARLSRAEESLRALDPATSAVRRSAHEQRVLIHRLRVASAQDVAAGAVSESRLAALKGLDDEIAGLQAQRAEALAQADEAKLARERGFRQHSQTYRDIQVGDITLPAAMAGERGAYFQKMISSDQSLDNVFRTNKKLVHGHMMSSFSQSGVSVSYNNQTAKLFIRSWDKAINHQIVQDELGRLAVKAVQDGRPAEDLAQWLKSTPQGRAYRKKLGIKYASNEDIAARIHHEVTEYMPTWEIRAAALEGKADEAFLKAAAEKGHRPMEVHSTQLGENLAGSNRMSGAMDRVIDRFFRTMASLPADRMSRHPLFNQLYEGHARTLISQEIKQGAKVAQRDADRIAEAARRLALRDTRRLVFDIAHRSDAAAALRFMSPFFAATTEAWQRWARIIADKPQIVGYAGKFYNAPAAWGWMQDADGNRILRDGTVIDPVTGKRKLVPKSERYIMARVPKFVADGPIGKAMGMSSDGKWLISQDSMNMVTMGDPWFNPGVGPIVQMPVNQLVKDKPDDAELMRHLGILPFGPSRGGLDTTVKDAVLPPTLKNFLTAFDTSDERYQQIKLQLMQKAAYEHANLGKPMPTAQQLADQTRDYWLFRASSAFLQPFATQKPDKYQFFRDQYNNLRRADPEMADAEFLERFGESYFIFAQATSTGSGIPATKKAVRLTREYGDLIAKNPDLAALIIGPEGEGPFSPEAYAYQLNNPLVPGGAEMQRTKMSADEAMKENERRLGWAKYTAMMNKVTAQMHDAGFKSFGDPGAEQFATMKRAVSMLYGEPEINGQRNPYYNEEWSKDFYTFDARKYERLIPDLEAVANSRLAENPNRSDLRMLKTYLLGRRALLQVLAERAAAGGAVTLRAKDNADLARNWTGFVDSLVEADTRFGDLHHRYLSRDLGVDVEEAA